MRQYEKYSLGEICKSMEDGVTVMALCSVPLMSNQHEYKYAKEKILKGIEQIRRLIE